MTENTSTVDFSWPLKDGLPRSLERLPWLAEHLLGLRVPSGEARGYLLTRPAFRISLPIASTSCLAKARTSFGSTVSLSPAQIN